MRRTQLFATALALVAQTVGAAGVRAGSFQPPIHLPAGHSRSLLPDSAEPAIPASTLSSIPRLLKLTWRGYKYDFIQGDGRIVDHSRAQVTTSEGQSYAMLRAVWMKDRHEFDLVWNWTRHNLQVRHDRLFGYLWGQKGLQWGILDKKSATDADEDIALALVFASHRWHRGSYLSAARAIIRDIWRVDVARVRGKPYLTAGSWAPRRTSPGPFLDPSYFAPYAYRIFARVDPRDNWLRLVKTSYSLLRGCSRSPLGSAGSVDLPPNWCAFSLFTGHVTNAPYIQNADTYGYDAFRTMWRVALDYIWNRASAAKKYLQDSSFLRTQWRLTGRLYEEYAHNGAVQTAREDPTTYGGDIGNFLVTDRGTAQTIAFTKLLPLFTQQGSVAYWGDRYNYYEQNWVWLGLAMVAGRLPNLAR